MAQHFAPAHLHAYIIQNLLKLADFHNDSLYNLSEHVDSAQYYQLGTSPTVMDWITAYIDDHCTKIMLLVFKLEENHTWVYTILDKIDVGYRSSLKEKKICLLHDKLIFYKAIFRDI